MRTRSSTLLVMINVGDTLTLSDLITAFQADARAQGSDADAAERSRISQAAFGVDLSGDPPYLKTTWVPHWLSDVERFQRERREQRSTLATVARDFARVPPGDDPFAIIIEGPPLLHDFWLQHGGEDRLSADPDTVVSELVCTLWNLEPQASVRVSTAAVHRGGPAAQVVDQDPDADEPISCPACGWTGVIAQTYTEYFRDVWHRECPRCEKILRIMSNYVD